MNACGAVEDKYSILAKGTINSLHLIRELYDHEILHDHMRIYLLTEKPYEEYRGRWLIPQEPYPKKKTWTDVVKKNRWVMYKKFKTQNVYKLPNQKFFILIKNLQNHRV